PSARGDGRAEAGASGRAGAASSGGSFVRGDRESAVGAAGYRDVASVASAGGAEVQARRPHRRGTMSHLTLEELSARLDDALTPARISETDRHLASCESCRTALADLAGQDDALGQVLSHDPGEAYFASFAARVEDRIRAAGMRGAQAKWEGGLRSWLRSPRRLAMAGVVAAVLGGAALVIITARMDRPEQALLES